ESGWQLSGRAMTVKQIGRNILQTMGLLERMRMVRRDLAPLPQVLGPQRYLRKLVALYRDPHSGPIPEFGDWLARRKADEVQRVRRRFESDRAALVRALLMQLLALQAGSGDATARPPEDAVEALADVCSIEPQRLPKLVPTMLE